MIIQIFIYVKEKTGKEIREEMELDRKWREMIEAEKRKKILAKEREKRKKQEAIEQRYREAELAYWEARKKNPWDYQFLPEGWSIFGQGPLRIIEEY